MKLRLDYFLSLGLKLVEGDVRNYKGNQLSTSSKQAEAINNAIAHDEMLWVTSFAPRKNTGAKPCADDLPVECEFESGMSGWLLASLFTWKDSCALNPVLAWKPDLEALIKMQIEHDKDIAKREEEKPVEWVNGDLVYADKEFCVGVFVGDDGGFAVVSSSPEMVQFCNSDSYDVYPYGDISKQKPETAKQKETRARVKQLNKVLEKQIEDVNELEKSLSDLTASNFGIIAQIIELESEL